MAIAVNQRLLKLYRQQKENGLIMVKKDFCAMVKLKFIFRIYI